MLNITIDSNLNDLVKKLARIDQERQIPFASALAITDIAYKARDEVRKEIAASFDAPVALTKRAAFAAFPNKARRADKNNPSARVGVISDVSGGTPPAKYLEAEITGGKRVLKGYERALLRAGILKPGWYTTPGKGAALDRFGNIRSGEIVQMLAYLRANPEVQGNRNIAGKKKMKKRPSEFFVVFPDQGEVNGRKLPPGIYRRGALRYSLFMAFVNKAPTYRVRLPVHRIVEDAIRKFFPESITKALRTALKSAR